MRRENARVNGVEDYRERLLTRKMELLLSLRIRPETLAGPGAVAVEDLAPVFHEQFVALQISQLDLLQLKLVDAALDRMDSQDYGVCVDCGDPISYRRLAAIPWANRCIACQERSIPSDSTASALCRTPAVSTSRTGIPSRSNDSETVSRVVPGIAVTIARSR